MAVQSTADESDGWWRDMKAKPLHPVLTPREYDIVRCVVAGMTNGEIAHELGLCEQTIKNALSVVYQKCDVHSRLQLALFAVRNHLASPRQTTVLEKKALKSVRRR
jgi:DNA-binding NarL/FixJ family response regulator